MTFVVHFTDDIGTAEQNAHLGEQLADDIESLLLGYLDGGINPHGAILSLGSEFGIEVQDAGGATRDVRVLEVHYVEPADPTAGGRQEP